MECVLLGYMQLMGYDVVLLRGWCGTLKRLMWYFEEGGMLN